MAECDRLAIAERERAAFLEERNQTRRELDSVRERMNRLAVECERLAKAAAENQEAADTLRLIEEGSLHCAPIGHGCWRVGSLTDGFDSVSGTSLATAVAVRAKAVGGWMKGENLDPRDAVLALAKELEGKK